MIAQMEIVVRMEFEPFSVVVNLNILENIHLSLFRCVIIGTSNKLSFQGAVEGLHDCIVIGIAFAAHALNTAK